MWAESGAYAVSSFYEGHSINHITFPIRVLKLLGIDTLIGTLCTATTQVAILVDQICDSD